MKRCFVFFSFLLLMLTGIGFVATAQDETCPALVDAALAAVDTACTGIERNQVCYGSTRVSAATWEETTPPDFDTPGDMLSIVDIMSLATEPFDVQQHVWGIAILNLQANLPDTTPGQNVTFVVFGDAQIRSEVQPTESVTYPAQANSNANLRSGPGTDFEVVGSIQTGAEITLTGRNEAGDWLLLRTADITAWVYIDLVTVTDDVLALPVFEADSAVPSYTAPMQAFRMTTGIGESACQEVPRDGLLVQAPSTTTVNFLMNGIQVQLGSTAFITAETEQDIEVSTLEGTVQITSAGETRIVEPGFTVNVTEGQAPGEPVPYSEEDMQAVPIQLLPEDVLMTQDGASAVEATAEGTLAVVSSTTFTVPGDALPGALGWIDSGVFVNAAQVFTVSATGQIEGWPECQIECPTMDWISDCNNVCNQSSSGPGGSWSTIADVLPSGSSQFPLPSAMWWSLVGRVGEGESFSVGQGGTFVADSDGTIQFIINDLALDPTDNNPGAFTVIIEVLENE